MEIVQGECSVVSSEDSSMRDVICDLLKRPFSIRNLTERKAIVRMQQSKTEAANHVQRWKVPRVMVQ